MALDKFFAQGNKLGVFGSFVYMPDSAGDFDFTLFTHDGKNPFKCAPQYSPEVKNFLESKLGPLNLKMDFMGNIWSNPSSPYNIDNLPKDDVTLDGRLLVGVFYPDISFLVAHYQSLFGDDFLIQPWLRFIQHVESFQSSEIRIDKRHKDLPLILKATERLIEYGRTEYSSIVNRYKTQYQNLRRDYTSGKITIMDYERKSAQMVLEFSHSAGAVISDKAA